MLMKKKSLYDRIMYQQLQGGYYMDFCGKKLPPCMIGTWAWGTGVNGSRMVFWKSV